MEDRLYQGPAGQGPHDSSGASLLPILRVPLPSYKKSWAGVMDLYSCQPKKMYRLYTRYQALARIFEFKVQKKKLASANPVRAG